ncbi:MAG: hypothetical protein V4696_02435 [Pseudomonadota bacterium]
MLSVHLLRTIEVFLRTSGVPATRFGREAVNDPRFVFDLRRGREPGPRTVARIVEFLEDAQ